MEIKSMQTTNHFGPHTKGSRAHEVEAPLPCASSKPVSAGGLIIKAGGRIDRPPMTGSFLAQAGSLSGDLARKVKMAKAAARSGTKMTRNTKRTAQWIKESTRSRAGPRPNITAMYTMGNHFQSQAIMPNVFAMPIGIARMNGIGNQRTVPMRLKNKWAKATFNPVWILLLANALRIPVHVVPMLAPTVKQNILSSLTMPMPTRGVSVDVVTLLDCIRMVMHMPNTMRM
mmetsp:Transcript_37068/g.86860  ORF Transcript_37068/g.86860 Transcript_37068/m.86860 type:complete len:229 (+) Transcript_37068:936-1622(+)